MSTVPPKHPRPLPPASTEVLKGQHIRSKSCFSTAVNTLLQHLLEGERKVERIAFRRYLRCVQQ